MPAIANAYVLEGLQWHSGYPISLGLQLGSPNGALIDGSTSWDQVAEAAEKEWNPHLGSGVQFRTSAINPAPAYGDGKNTVFFSNTIFGEDFGDGTLAVTLNHVNRGHINIESDVVVNNALPFDAYRGPLRANGKTGVYDLRRVLLHEFGHMLGLDHVSQDTPSIMTPAVTNVDTIQADDIAGVEAIYGPYQPPAAPVFDGSLNVYGTINVFFDYSINVSNGGFGDYQVSGLPPGLELAPYSNIILGTPTALGTYKVLITVINGGGGKTTATFTFNIVPTLKITGSLSATTYLGQPFHHQIAATGKPTKYTSSDLPAGLTLDPTTGVISGTPTAAGDFFLYLQASSPAGNDQVTFELVVAYDATLTKLQNVSPNAIISSLFKADENTLYGTTLYGGKNMGGVFFKLTSDGVLINLYEFSSSGSSFTPSDLHPAKDGSFYGVNSRGGANHNGAVFKISADGAMTTLGNFPASKSLNDLTYLPSVLQADDGNYYGVIPPATRQSTDSAGSIYKLTPNGVLTILHQFNGSDGFYPSALMRASDGDFYGTTNQGGSGSCGTVFKITREGQLTILHSFIGADGAYPVAPLIQGKDGNFYGTTAGGPNKSGDTVFKMTPDGTLTTLHVFTPSEGRRPGAALVQDDNGDFYGSTDGYFIYGFSVPTTTLFKLTPDGTLTTLHTFAGGEGTPSFLPLIPDGAGNFYGANNPLIFKENPNAVPLDSAPPPVALPTVTLTSTVPQVTAGSREVGEFVLNLSSAQDHDMIVNFIIKGTATNGADYTLLKSPKKIKAGKTSKPIKIIPQGDMSGAAKKTVVLVLEPGDGYTVGTIDKVKVKILAEP